MISSKEIFKYTNRISIELSNLCNYADIHKRCPLSIEQETKILPSRIAYDVLNTLNRYNFNKDKTIAFHTYNEPLIDPRLFVFIKYTREKCPESNIYICTNGYYLDSGLASELVSVGISEIRVTAYSQKEFDRLSKIKIDIPYHCEMMRLDDRLNLYKRPINVTEEACFAPLNEIIIAREGVISLCCLDWQRKYCFGDLRKESFEKVLKSGQLHEVYKRLSRGDRFLDLCKRCNWVR